MQVGWKKVGKIVKKRAKMRFFAHFFAPVFPLRRHEENQMQISLITQRNTAANLHEEILPRRMLPASAGPGGRGLSGSRQAGFIKAGSENGPAFAFARVDYA